MTFYDNPSSLGKLFADCLKGNLNRLISTGKGKTCESYDYETPRTEQAMAALPSS